MSAGPRLVAGVGSRRGVRRADLHSALAECLAVSGGRFRDLVAIATAEGKQHEPALRELCDVLSIRLSVLPAEQLAQQPVPSPSEIVAALAGTPSVAEAAVLALGARLLVPKHAAKGVTIALGLLPPAQQCRCGQPDHRDEVEPS